MGSMLDGYAYREIGLWIRTAVRREIPELTLECGDILIQLPLRLLTCKTLVILDLKGWIDLNIPVTASLPSLKTLHIVLLRKSNYEHFSRILSSFSLRVDLMVEQRTSNAISTLDIAVPSLQRLFIRTVTKKDNGLRYSPHEKSIPKVMINAPCLKYLNIDDRGNDFNVIKDLTQVVEATINAKETSTKKHSNSWICPLDRWDVPSCVPECMITIPWNPPSTAPACMLSSLQILNWSAYSGVPGEKDLAIYMLKNASHLKTATIWSDECDIPELEMLKELAFSSRASTTCEFLFD
ncbi:hypothetical protein Bca101_032424 [Brassica carinata]